MYGLTFNGKHSFNDFGVYLKNKTILPPSKTKILETVPYMSGNYDFSTVGSNGEQVFDTRPVKVSLDFKGINKSQLQVLYSNICSWLLDCGQEQLIFDDMQEYYFLAEVISISSYTEVRTVGHMEIEFTCEPFRYNVNLYGADIWDTFYFDTDYTAYSNAYTINGATQVTVGNGGRQVTPIITVTAPMTLVFNNITYNLAKGDNTIYGLKLQNGENTLTFTGQGTATINFRAEVI